MKFIAQRLASIGHLNRSALQQEFGISIPQASIDLGEFQAANPGAMFYDRKQKRYLRADMNGTFHCPICMNDRPHKHQLDHKWIGVDFDGTLSRDPPGRYDPYTLGPPIEAMVDRVKGWLAQGYTVKILTARMFHRSHTQDADRDVKEMERLLKAWCLEHVGRELDCTCVKDHLMEVLWDDRAVRVVRDTGQPAEFAHSAGDKSC